jgi:hypothetical protein
MTSLAIAGSREDRRSLDPKCAVILDRVREGDLIFTGAPSWRRNPIQRLTNTWVDHVGLVHWSEAQSRWTVLESIYPKSKQVELCRFVTRGGKTEVSLRRLREAVDPEVFRAASLVAKAHLGEPYDLKFDLKNPGARFCTKFINFAFEAAGLPALGATESLGEIADRAMSAGWISRFEYLLGLVWFGPGGREIRTITPKAQFEDDRLEVVWEEFAEGAL